MFENIIGLNKQKEILSETLRKDNISHSYLFAGKSGIGKCMLAKEFAKVLLGTDTLATCPDFKYITKNDDKKEIIIEQIRKEIIDDVYVAPISSSRKVYIIDDANLLNVASQNALLKTLEEPPEYVVIILITSSVDSFLTTVKSRLNILEFSGIENEKVYEYILEKYNVKLTDTLLQYIDGSIGQAIYLVENEYSKKFENVEKLYQSIMKKDYVSTFQTAQNIDFTDTVLLDFFEHIIYINGKYNLIEFVEKARTRLKKSGNYDIVIDSMILRIINIV